jgi:hypothetical protein
MTEKRCSRIVGKKLGRPCLVCGERRRTEKAHFPRRKRLGEEGVQTIPMCPTHHMLLDQGRLNRKEFESIMKNMELNQFDEVADFVAWAHNNGYPYSVEDLKKKFWDYEYS